MFQRQSGVFDGMQTTGAVGDIVGNEAIGVKFSRTAAANCRRLIK